MSSKRKESKRPAAALDMKTVGRLLSYLAKHKWTMIAVIVCILISSLATVFVNLFLRSLIDDHIVPLLAMETPDYSGLIKALVNLGVISLVGTAASWLYNWSIVAVAQNVLKRIRDEMFEKMQRLSIRYFDSHTHGELMSHYTNDTDTLRQMLTQGLPNIIAATFTVITVFFSMFYLSVYLTLIVVLILVLIMIIMKNVTKRSGAYFLNQQEALGDLNGYVEEMVNGQKVVKVFSHEEAAKKGFHKKNEVWRQNSTKATSIGSVIMPMMNALGSIQYVILAMVGGFMAVAGLSNLTITGVGTMSLGTIASFLLLARSFTNPISQIANQFTAIVMAVAGATRIFALMDEKPESDEGVVTLVNAKEVDGELCETEEKTGIWAWKRVYDEGKVAYIKLQGDVVFDHVDFSYTPDHPVLHDISLYAKPGQKVAFVGATGAGKTTITNLINRFYDIDDGKIRYDGVNINRIKKADLRRSLGVVLQDVNLFTGTVMENIRYGNLEATDEKCIAAAKLANAHNFIKMLPQGYDTMLKGDGSGLSQGQRQLISIARAAVCDPPVMILDEATSSIDTRTEAMVQKGMDRLMEGRTVFVIAHRLSTVQNSDVIMVLDHGRIIERGSHEELIEEGGTYYQLYTGAFELE